MTITTMKHKTTHNTPIKYPYQHQETMDGSQKKNTLPFWLGHEDSDQLEKITQLYTNYLHLDNTNDNSPTKAARAARWNNKSSSSSSLNEDDLINYAQRPMDFIGKIVRYPLIDQRPFVTLDIVQIYKREAIVQGKSFPYSNTMYVETEWDLLDGLPIHFKTCSKKHVTSVASEQSNNNPPYIIITSPIFTSDKSCTYRSVVGSDNIYSSVGYCDLFSQCLERSLERSPCSERDQEEDEEEEDDDLEFDDDEYGDDYFDEDSDEEEEPQTKSHDDYLQSLLCPKASSSSICEFSSFTFYTSTTVTATSQEEVDCDEDDQAQWDEWEEEEELDSPPHIPHHYCNISIRI